MLQWRREAHHCNKLHSLRRIVQFNIYSTTPSIFTPIRQPLTETPIKESIFTLCESDLLRKALEFVDSSNHHGSTADPETFASLLQNCADENDLEGGKQIHAQIITNNFAQNLFLSNKLISMYGKCWSPLDAWLVFNRIDKPNLISWNSMLRVYAMHGFCEEVLKLFRKMQLEGVKADNFTLPSVLKASAGMSFLEQGKEIHGFLIKYGFDGDLGVGKAIVNMYGKCGSVEDARIVFDKMPQQDLVLWNVMIASYSQNDYCYEAFEVFRRMLLSGEMPNCVTVATLLQVCACSETAKLGKNVHSYGIKRGLQAEILVGNALGNMYAKCWGIWDASRVFNEMSKKDVVSWNAMIAGYGQHGLADQASEHLYQMLTAGVKPNLVTTLCVLSFCNLSQGKETHAYVIRSGLQLDVSVGNALVDMYSKCTAIKLARRVFEKIAERDIISWNAIIAGYAQNAYFAGAIHLFGQMQLAGLKPDAVTIACVLSACACLENLRKGKEIHAYIIRSGAFSIDIAVSNALISLYVSCGV